MRFSIRVRKWHKWIALVVGIQVLFWTVSGVFMSLVPIETVRSEHLVKKDAPKSIEPGNYLSVNQVLAKFGKSEVRSLRFSTFLDLTVFEVKLQDGRTVLMDAVSGKRVSPVTEKQVRRIARSRFSGDAKIQHVTLQREPLIEYRGKLPVWKVDFDTGENTSFYISTETGKLTAVRGRTWRIYDFLWMLHIMDYDEREDFNHPLLIVAALLGLALTVSGILLIRYSMKWIP